MPGTPGRGSGRKLLINRRQFFRGVWKSPEQEQEEKRESDRRSRQAELRRYVRSHLFPIDFRLSGDQQSSLMERVEAYLGGISDEKLFSIAPKGELEELVGPSIDEWRGQSSEARSRRVHAIRQAALEAVPAFLDQTSPEERQRLEDRFKTEEGEDLEAPLQRKVWEWTDQIGEDELLALDPDRIREPVFTQLRSWC